MLKLNNRRQHQSGFTLIEALITLLVIGFGMLSIAGMQLSLSRNGDLAKQRTEATRLAQERIETLRAFTGIAAGNPNWNALAGGVEQIAPTAYLEGVSNGTNVAYTRTLTLGGGIADPLRAASVTVGWTDRTGELQSVTLSTVLSKTNPVDSGFLTFPQPQNTNLKRPKNRSLNIPVPSIDLGRGKSALSLSPNLTIVFSDITGSVVQKCSGIVNAISYASGTGDGNAVGCTGLSAVILAGFVSGAINTTVVAVNFTNQVPNDIAVMPSGVNTSGISGWDTSGGKTISCIYRVASDQETGAEIPSSHYYLCVIPVTPTGTGSAWSGRVRLGGVTTSSNTKVCRFQYFANSSTSDNLRNVQPYSNVSESLDNQNYHIENSNGEDCPILDTETLIARGSLVRTVLHQDCRGTFLSGLTSGLTSATAANGSCPATIHNTSVGF